jgi:predicted RNase H-like HicB family nuclease
MNSKHYEIIIYWSDADAAFIAEVPELPGCMADGVTYEQALENAQSTMRDWIETATQLSRPVPVPRGRLMFA